MPKKKSFSLKEFRKLLGSKSLLIGTKRTLTNMKKGNIEKVFISSNCPKNVINNLNYYASLSKVDLINLKYSNEELGVICKKQFSISLLSLLKGEV